MSVFSFKTIKKPISEILLKEKGSKFIGFASPISSEEDFKNYLAEIKKTHPKATHHCYAFRIGIDGENHRANDDGEPNGSAGLPIFNQILAKELTNICVVVVRYYGGTKLGVSGLVKAYKNCAQETLDLAEFITKDLTILIEINFKFSVQNSIFSLINKYEGKILEFITAGNCTIKAEIKSVDFEKFIENLAEIHEVNFEILED
ncbi:IMPACT family protein [Halpernia sp.]|uniref:IMPACT family protein n=1 Tax=Halpernia sp. TaxID=2782209 RepID=UPI003A94B90C